LIADQVNDVEVLSQADEVAVIAGTTAALGVMNIGRSRDQTEDDAGAPQGHAPAGVARRQSERCGGALQRLFDESAVQANDIHGPIDT
jgi:hypothetical protein